MSSLARRATPAKKNHTAENQPGLPFGDDRLLESGPAGFFGLESDNFDLTSLPSDCTAIKLTNGGYTLVDEEDACRVDERDWFKTYNNDKTTWYARTLIKTELAKYQITMHRFLYGLDRGDRTQVDHKNHDGLDNRRSANLRLATPAQNCVNVRKLGKFASKYRGVTWAHSSKKWKVVISRDCGNTRKRFWLGVFSTEAEAAFAFQVAAPLLKDPEFLHLEEIPKDELPDAKRLEEIRHNTIAKVKAAIAGRKGKLNARSSYNGVSRHVGTGKWEASLEHEGRMVRVGLYGTEDEAAYAHNRAVQILKLTGRKINEIDRDDLDSPGRADEIDADVALRLEALRTGEKFYRGSASRYRGVSPGTSRTPWKAVVVDKTKNMYLGLYSTEIEAAVAYNIAIGIVGTTRLKPNLIAPADMPNPEVVEAIRAKVVGRLTSQS